MHVLYVGLGPKTGSRVTATLEERWDSIETTTAVDSADGMERLNSQSFDCIVSSNSLGDGTGIEFLRSVRESFPALPYVLLAETLSDELIRNAIDAGVTDYLPQRKEEAWVSLLADRIVDAITQYRAAESAGELERINTVVRDINRALVRASTTDEIDHRVCEIINDSEPYVFAWIGEHDPESNTVTGRAAVGVGEGYLDEITITSDKEPTAQGPTGRAVRTHEIQVMQNIPEDPAYAPWREEALERGYKSSAAIPLVYGETLYGVLNVYADRTDAFDPDEQELLEELGDTIAYTHHEIEIHAEARQFQRAVEQAADAILITDTDGEIEYVNPAFEKLTGYTVSDAVGENPRILKSGEHPQEYYETMWETILDGDIWASEIVNTKRSGEQYHAEQTVAPIKDDSNDIEGFVAIQRDITDRKEHEKILERREAYLEQSHDIITVVDADGTVQFQSKSAAEITGFSPKKIVGKRGFEFLHPDDRDEMMQLFTSFIQEGKDEKTVEFRIETKDGSWRWVEARAVNKLDEPLIEGIIISSRDITQRKERELQIQELTNRLELAAEAADLGIWELDTRTEDMIWEESMEKLLGLDPGSFGGTYGGFIERIHPKDRETVEEVIEGALERQDSFEQEFRLYHESDNYIWILTRAHVLTETENGSDRMVGISIDISERADRARQLRVMDRMLRHNLRNDMTAIQGNAETIQAEADSVHEEAQTIVEKSRQLMGTVEKEREIVEVITEQPEYEEIDAVGDVCRRVVATMRDEHPEATIEFDHPEKAPVIATKKLGRAIEELLENSIIHNDRETPEVSLTVEPHEDTVRVEIADNGPGIPEEEVNVLTWEYEIEPLYHGSGLGLWLVNWIVRESEGTLRFEENEPRGSIVRIELQRAT